MSVYYKRSWQTRTFLHCQNLFMDRNFEIDWVSFSTKFLRGFAIMAIICNNICQRYKAKKPNNIGRYLSGQKRCNACDIYMHWDGLWCPCCNYKLRQTPRSSKYKEKYMKALSEKKEVLTNGV
jgi:hypothetical protein